MANPLINHKWFYPRTSRSRDLRKLFNHWNQLLSRATTRLASSKNPDSPFWYGERSHVGWLALAVHETGWIPLQEPYVTRKRKGAGRTDLWGILGHRKTCRVYDFEAKFANLNLSSLVKKRNSFLEVDDIENKLDRAVKQTKSKHNEHAGDIGVGLVFVLLYTSHGTTKSEQIHLLKHFEKTATTRNAMKEKKLDFIALYSANYSSIKKIVDHYKGKYEPCLGIAVAGRIA